MRANPMLARRPPWTRVAILTVLGAVVLVGALLTFGGQVQQCLSPCLDTRPAWLASLSPIERFAVEHPDALPILWLGLPLVAVLGVELVWRLVRRAYGRAR
jgi:hypothetical protein